MHFKIEKRDALKTFKELKSSLIKSRFQTNIENCFLLMAGNSNNFISVRSASIDGYQVRNIPAIVLSSGESLVNSDELIKFLSVSGDQPIEIRSDRNKIHLQTQKGSRTVEFENEVSSVDDYVENGSIEESDIKFQTTFDRDDILRIIDKTSFAISKEETRYYLNGLCFKVVDGNFRIVATNGAMLAQVALNRDVGAMDDVQFIVPSKVVENLQNAIKNLDVDDIKFTFSNVFVSIELGNGNRLFNKLIDGTFPDTDRVIQSAVDDVEKYGTILKVSKKELIESIKENAFMSKNLKEVFIKFDKDNIEISTKLGGKSKFSCNASDAGELVFNSKKFLDIVTRVHDEEVIIRIPKNGEKVKHTPTVIGCETDSDVTNLLMTIKG